MEQSHLTLDQFRRIYGTHTYLKDADGNSAHFYCNSSYARSSSGHIACSGVNLYNSETGQYATIMVAPDEYVHPKDLYPDIYDLNFPFGTEESYPTEVDQLEVVNDEPKKIRVFETGAVRSDDSGRPRPDWISPYAINAIGAHLAKSANDFGACNYFLGIPEKDILPSLSRHLTEIQEAILITGDNEELHSAVCAMAFNSIAMIHTLELRKRGRYNAVYNGTQYVELDEAKKLSTFTK